MTNEQAIKESMSKNNMHRIYAGEKVLTIWKSIGTPDIYYWYDLKEVPTKISDSIIFLFESICFYDIDNMIDDLKNRGLI